MISVVIPAYNNPADVEELLASLTRHCAGMRDYEVIVVDDGSRDDAIHRVSEPYAGVRVLKLPHNRGAAAARNAGVAIALYDLLLFLDSDMVVLSDVIDIARAMFQDSNVQAAVGAISPRPLNPGWFKTFWALVKAFSLPKGRYSSTFYPMIGVMRKHVFEAIGGFDEEIKGASIEDYELSLRLESHQYRVHYNPSLLVGTHYKGIVTSLKQSFWRTVKWVLLFWRRKRFDNHTTTGAQAAGALCGVSLLGALLLALGGYGSPALIVGLLGLYLYLNNPFLRYVGSTVGVWFIPVAIFFHLILSVVVTVGAARGALQLLFGPQRCRFLLYR